MTGNGIGIIGRLCCSETGQEESIQNADGFFVRKLPAELLRDINIVDTPGTNVIVDRQQRLTEEYVPRADLVLFCMSAGELLCPVVRLAMQTRPVPRRSDCPPKGTVRRYSDHTGVSKMAFFSRYGVCHISQRKALSGALWRQNGNSVKGSSYQSAIPCISSKLHPCLAADRPFTESETQFLRYIRQWGKKVVFIVNKVDILSNNREVEEVTRFVGDSATRLLGVERTQVLPVSARAALEAKLAVGGGTMAGPQSHPLLCHTAQNILASQGHSCFAATSQVTPWQAASRNSSQQSSHHTCPCGVLAFNSLAVQTLLGTLCNSDSCCSVGMMNLDSSQSRSDLQVVCSAVRTSRL